MAISLNTVNSTLNNHATRITALENKQSSTQTVFKRLLTINAGAKSSFVLSESIDNYDMIVVEGASDNLTYRMLSVHIPSNIVTNQSYRFWGTDAIYWHVKVASDRKTFTTLEENSYLYRVIGIKFPNTLYNLYYKLYSIREVVRKWLSL